MKAIRCDECSDVVMMPIKGVIKRCYCGKYHAKYLNDGITLIVNGEPVVIGIDNNTFSIAVERAEYTKEWTHRVDFFFTGWIPNHPGEVIFVNTIDDVIKFEEDFDTGNKGYSTMPNGGS